MKGTVEPRPPVRPSAPLASDEGHPERNQTEQSGRRRGKFLPAHAATGGLCATLAPERRSPDSSGPTDGSRFVKSKGF